MVVMDKGHGAGSPHSGPVPTLVGLCDLEQVALLLCVSVFAFIERR